MLILAKSEFSLQSLSTRASIKGKYMIRVATFREKSLENEFFSRSGKSQGILIEVREI